MNTVRDNSLLLLMVVLVPISALTAVILHKKFPIDVFPVALLTIYIAILFALWLTTNYIVGYDSNLELYSFKLTDNASMWNPISIYSEIDKGTAMLSTTVLPTIYSKILNLDATWVFKIIYPLLASFVPLGLYQFYSMQTRKEVAFLGTFLFITHALDGLGSLKEWIASIFYILLFYIIFSDKIPSSKKKILFIIFAGALAVSHYARSYIFLFILIFMWVIPFLLKRSTRVTLSMILIFFSMSFAWYMFTTQGSVFEASIGVIENIYRSLSSEFFNPEARGPTVMTALGLVEPPTYLHMISRLFFYLTVFLITIGFASIFMKFLKKEFDLNYFTAVSVNMAILAMAIIVPNLAESLRMTRFYRITLVFLAPLCVLGAEEILHNIHKFKFVRLGKKWLAPLLMFLILMPHFLFQTGFVYEVAKVECWSIPLSRYRMPPTEVSQYILYGSEVFGALWLSTYSYNCSPIYSDAVSRYRALVSYGLINYWRFRGLSNTTTALENKSFVYLRRLNTVNEIMVEYYAPYWNTTDIQSLIDLQNKIYSNGDCIIYKGLP
jgi:uncharacterized membrane protein